MYDLRIRWERRVPLLGEHGSQAARSTAPAFPGPAARGAPPVQGPYVRLGKPVLDTVLAAVALVLLLPVMGVVAMAVYASMGGPVIFGQTRIGLDGEPFTVLKFRSMHADRRRLDPGYDGADRRLTHKSARDPRLTPTGRVIRKLSLDELPQLINVLRGEMSIVGPRPELPSVIERHYSPWQHRRHVVKPGITGLWQTTERRDGMMHEYVDVDLDYVDSVSLRTDLRIIVRTIPAALATNQGV